MQTFSVDVIWYCRSDWGGRLAHSDADIVAKPAFIMYQSVYSHRDTGAGSNHCINWHTAMLTFSPCQHTICAKSHNDVDYHVRIMINYELGSLYMWKRWKQFKGFREIQKLILHLKSYVEANIHRRQWHMLDASNWD